MTLEIILFLLLLAFLVAQVEIQIEGKHGWAESLPTWRKENKWTKFILGEYPLTGYHLWLLIMLMTFFHFPFVLGITWNFAMELHVLAYFFLFIIFEDFFWFAVNPHYGLRKFNSQAIPWHDKWWGIVPLLYIKLAVVAGVLFLVSLKV